MSKSSKKEFKRIRNKLRDEKFQIYNDNEDEKDIIINPKLQHHIWSDFYIIVYILDFLGNDDYFYYDDHYDHNILKLRLINKFFANNGMGEEMMKRLSLNSPRLNFEIIPNLEKIYFFD